MNDDEIASALKDGLHVWTETLLMCFTNPWELDEAMTSFGFSDGVCRAQDDEGLDVGLSRLTKHVAENRIPATPILSRMVAEGRLGRQTGVGWYRYPGGGGHVVDPLVEDLLREEARFAKVTRRELGEEDLVQRLVAGISITALEILAHEGKHVKSRVDQMSQDAIGFPKSTGGILSYTLGVGYSEASRRLGVILKESEHPQHARTGLNLLFG